MNIEHFAIAEHLFLTKHSIKFDKVEILANSAQYYEREMIEAIEIRKNKNNFIKEKDFEISNTLIPVLSKLNPKRIQEIFRNDKKRSGETQECSSSLHTPSRIPERAGASTHCRFHPLPI